MREWYALYLPEFIIDKYIVPTNKQFQLLSAVEETIKSSESCVLRLIHFQDITYSYLASQPISRMDQSPLSQVILENDSVRLTFGRDILGENNVIQTVSKYTFMLSPHFLEFRNKNMLELFFVDITKSMPCNILWMS